MNADLENELKELGPGYRAVVDRLMAARTVEPRRGLAPVDGEACGKSGLRGVWRPAWCVAASIVVLLGMAFLFRGNEQEEKRYTVRVLDATTAYRLAYSENARDLDAILASQRQDGSWDNDFITCQNAAALRHGRDADSRVAYRKAVRYLKSKGLAPLSDDQLRARVEFARRF